MVAETLVCSDCFHDEGLRLDAKVIGTPDNNICPNCGSTNGSKLNRDMLASLAHRFFVWGSLAKTEYGAAPLVQFNEHQQTSIKVSPWLEPDLRLIEKELSVGFFRYGPRLWMIGEVEPLKALRTPTAISPVVERILRDYPTTNIMADDAFYRLRKFPSLPADDSEYDSPPIALAGSGRLDSKGFPVLYASPDLQVCIHECRVTAEDDLYVATLAVTSSLRLLDLSVLLSDEKVNEFESLDIAVNMLFLAAAHSYPITRNIALAARSAGFDGLVYPSYFSLLRTGTMPFETAYGISQRRIPSLKAYEQAKTIPNLAIFGRPIAEKKVVVRSINKLILHHVDYGVHFGQVSVD